MLWPLAVYEADNISNLWLTKDFLADWMFASPSENRQENMLSHYLLCSWLWMQTPNQPSRKWLSGHNLTFLWSVYVLGCYLGEKQVEDHQGWHPLWAINPKWCSFWPSILSSNFWLLLICPLHQGSLNPLAKGPHQIPGTVSKAGKIYIKYKM